MPLYEFRCSVCTRSKETWCTSAQQPPLCCDRPMRRVFTAPAIHRSPTDAYFSPALGKPVSSRRQFLDELKRLEDRRGQELEIVEDADQWAKWSRIPEARTDRHGKIEGAPVTRSAPLSDEGEADSIDSARDSQVDRLSRLGSRDLAKRYIEERRR